MNNITNDAKSDFLTFYNLFKVGLHMNTFTARHDNDKL